MKPGFSLQKLQQESWIAVLSDGVQEAIITAFSIPSTPLLPLLWAVRLLLLGARDAKCSWWNELGACPCLDAIIHMCYNSYMDNNRKTTLFAALAAVCAASTAPLAANQSINHIFLVLPLVVMGVFLFAAGYYAGLARNKK